jgi:hypothetical protein
MSERRVLRSSAGSFRSRDRIERKKKRGVDVAGGGDGRGFPDRGMLSAENESREFPRVLASGR